MNKLFNDYLGNLYYILEDLNASESQKSLVKSITRKLQQEIGSDLLKISCKLRPTKLYVEQAKFEIEQFISKPKQ